MFLACLCFIVPFHERLRFFWRAQDEIGQHEDFSFYDLDTEVPACHLSVSHHASLNPNAATANVQP